MIPIPKYVICFKQKVPSSLCPPSHNHHHKSVNVARHSGAAPCKEKCIQMGNSTDTSPHFEEAHDGGSDIEPTSPLGHGDRRQRKTWSVLFSWPHIGRGGLSHRSCSRITQITSRLAAHLLPSSLLRAADASVYSLTNASPVSAP